MISKAVSLARGAQSKLSFIYVDASYVSTIGLVKTAVDKVEAEEKGILQKELQALAVQVDYPITNTLVVMGNLNDTLKTTVKEMDVDLLVCGHHHDFWSRLLSSVLTIPKLPEDADSEERADARTRHNMKIMVIPFSNVVTQSWLSSVPPTGQGGRKLSSAL